MQCNSTFRAQQIGNALDATHSKRVALKIRLTKRGLMRLFWIRLRILTQRCKAQTRTTHLCV